MQSVGHEWQEAQLRLAWYMKDGRFIGTSNKSPGVVLNSELNLTGLAWGKCPFLKQSLLHYWLARLCFDAHGWGRGVILSNPHEPKEEGGSWRKMKISPDSYTAAGNVKEKPFWKTAQHFLKKLNSELPHGTSNSNSQHVPNKTENSFSNMNGHSITHSNTHSNTHITHNSPQSENTLRSTQITPSPLPRSHPAVA